MLGSVPVDITGNATFILDGEWIILSRSNILLKTRPLKCRPGTVNISITPVNDPPNPVDVIAPWNATEDLVSNFNLNPGTDDDYTDTLSLG